jgi:hypothetical protein
MRINPKSKFQNPKKYYKIQNPKELKNFFVVFEFWISFVVFVVLVVFGFILCKLK